MSVSSPLTAPAIPDQAAIAAAAQDGPLAYSIDVGLGVVFIDLLEADDAPTLVQALHRIRLNSMFAPTLHACVDCRHLSSVPGPSDIRVIARLVLHAVTDDLSGRVAIVACSAAAYASARLFATLTKIPADRRRVVRTHSDALVWLRLGTDNLESDSVSTNATMTPSGWVARAVTSGQLTLESGRGRGKS